MWGDFDPKRDLTPARQKLFRDLDHIAAEYPEYEELVARTKAEIKRLLVFDTPQYLLDRRMPPGAQEMRNGALYHGPDPLT